jgi:ribosomal-protein-alanine N-acetyltransferase
VTNELLTDDVVCLRPWSERDAAWYADNSRDVEIQRFTTDPPTLTAAEVARAIARLAENPDAASFLIAAADNGEALGNIALDREGSVGHVSYWIAARARGRGAATSALRLLARWAFLTLGIIELQLWTHTDNAASRAVAEKAGFVRDPERDRQREVKGAVWETVAYKVASS